MGALWECPLLLVQSSTTLVMWDMILSEQINENAWQVEIGQNHCQCAPVSLVHAYYNYNYNYVLATYYYSSLFEIPVVANCSDPGTPVNGNTFLTATIITVGSVANHTCNTGFVLNGADQRVCLPTAVWSAPLPSCIGRP